MTRWRVVRAPGKGGKPGSYAVLSDRQPGPVMGSRGGLHGWSETREPAAWLTFEEACLVAATGNGKPSTANMEPREAAERGGAT